MVKIWRKIDKVQLVIRIILWVLVGAVVVQFASLILMTLSDILERKFIFSASSYSELANNMYKLIIVLFILQAGLKKR